MSITALLAYFAAALIGLAVGSFLAVLALRLPRRQPIVLARSACPSCGHVLAPRELIPLASWLAQRRRCRACGTHIPAFYPAMEVAAALVAVASVAWVPWPAAVAACVLGWTILTAGALFLRR